MKADIYSVGVVFYSTLTCKYPKPLSWPASVTDARIKEIITAMLSPNPANRPSAEQLLADAWFSQDTIS